MTATNLTTKKIPLPASATSNTPDTQTASSDIINIPPGAIVEYGMAFARKYRKAFERLS